MSGPSVRPTVAVGVASGVGVDGTDAGVSAGGVAAGLGVPGVSVTVHKSTYLAFHKQRPQTEMRTTVGDIHDRFIIWDGTQGFHLGHSIKDLGTKDTQLNLIAAPHQHLTLFEQRWKQAAEII